MTKLKENGFTLLELMIASAILIVALVGLLAAFTGSFVLNEGSKNLTVAINDAQCVMEEIRDRNVRSNITQENWTMWAATDLPDGGGCNTLDNESITVTFPSGIDADPLEILVTVSWTDKNRQRSTQLVTMLTER